MSNDEHATNTDWGQQGLRMLFALACLIIVLAGMKYAATVLVPTAFAFFLAILSYPLVRLLVRWRVPRTVALVLTVMVNVGILAGVIYSGVSLVSRFQRELPRSKAALVKNVTDAADWAESQGWQGAKQAVQEHFDVDKIIDYVTSGDVMKAIGGGVITTFNILAVYLGELFMVLIVMIFIIIEAHGTEGRFAAVRLAGGPDLSSLLQSVTDIQKYLGIKTMISAAVGVLAGIWCWILGLQYPLLWALLAFVFHFIPAVGAWAAVIPAAIDGLVQDGWGLAFGVLLGYMVINLAFDSFVGPMLLGRRFGLSTLVVVLSVIFWGWLWGGVGMFLAVPLTMVFKVLLDNSHEFRWLSVAMSKKKVVGGEIQLADFDLDAETAELMGGGASTEPPLRR